MTESKNFDVRVTGDLACFTRPEMKVERVSYEVMTPSAAIGLLEAVLWKPAMEWRVHEIVVQAPIKWTSFRRNEVNSTASPRTKNYYADEDRAQRNTVALKDVDYVVSASFELTAQAGDGDNVAKFTEMFERRLSKGQHFHQPYLGCREFAAHVEAATERRPIDEQVTRPLGLMFFNYDYPEAGDKKSKPRPLFFDARLEGGVLQVPPKRVVLDQQGAS